MGEVCSLCGGNQDVENTGGIYMCASCRGKDKEIEPRLRFVRWAVEHGKITDFPGMVDELFQQSHQAS